MNLDNRWTIASTLLTEARRTPKRPIPGVNLPPYMTAKYPDPETCPFCNGPIPEDIKPGATHILECVAKIVKIELAEERRKLREKKRKEKTLLKVNA